MHLPFAQADCEATVIVLTTLHVSSTLQAYPWIPGVQYHERSLLSSPTGIAIANQPSHSLSTRSPCCRCPSSRAGGRSAAALLRRHQLQATLHLSSTILAKAASVRFPGPGTLQLTSATLLHSRSSPRVPESLPSPWQQYTGASTAALVLPIRMPRRSAASCRVRAAVPIAQCNTGINTLPASRGLAAQPSCKW